MTGSASLDTNGLLPILALSLALLVPYHVFFASKRERLTEIPHVPSLLPFIGYGPAYFSSISQNSVKLRQKFGDIYTMLIFGRLYCKVHKPEDVETLLRLPEKKASMLEAYLDLAGPSLPQPDKSKQLQASSKMKRLLDPRLHSGTPLIAHSVRPRNLQSWVPDIQQTLQQRFDTLLQDNGTVSLFDWCQDLISAVTVRMMLGAKVANSPDLLQRFVDLFNESDPEQGFSGPLQGLATMAEVTVRGERKIYGKVREILFPLIDEEMELVVNHKQRQNDDNGSDEDASALSSMVSSWYHRKLNGNGEELALARTRIANDLFSFTFAAFSNSFGMSAWVLFHYLRDTNGLQSVLREELLDKNNQATHTYPHLEATILEIGRLYTPGDLHRKLREDWTLPSNPNVTLPKGTVLLVSALTTMREESRFPNPQDIDIARDYKTAGNMFIPFGTGAHPCVGKKLALLEIALITARVIQQLDLELIPGDKDGTCEFTNQVLSGIRDHPPCDLGQPGFIWRPAVPIMIKYHKKGTKHA